jgi:hypothetical protein
MKITITVDKDNESISYIVRIIKDNLDRISDMQPGERLRVMEYEDGLVRRGSYPVGVIEVGDNIDRVVRLECLERRNLWIEEDEGERVVGHVEVTCE